MEKIKNNKLLAVTAVFLVGAIVFGSISAFAAEFKDYTPPSRWDINWFEWIDEHGNPTNESDPNRRPTWVQDYPYRALLFGGAPTTSGSQKHDSQVYIIFSKVPEIDLFTYEYRSGEKEQYQYGYIRARYDKDNPLLVNNDITIPVEDREPDVKIMSHSWPGVTSGPEQLNAWLLTTHNAINGRNYFDFDFYYQCCGTLKIKGLREITAVPYAYILTCQNPDGTGGGSESASNPGGGSSGGGSSEGESSGGGSSGGSESPGGEISFPDFSSYPDGSDWSGGSGDTGETGGGWSLPSWGNTDVTGEASGYVELKPGGDGTWGPVELKPGGNGQSISDWQPGDVSQGLYDFGWW